MKKAASILLLVLTVCVCEAATVFLAGDSTVADYHRNRAPMSGWGQALTKMARPGTLVRNHAIPGESARSFRDKKRWAKLEGELRPGDYVLIQFGHNDQKKDSPTHYAEAMTDYKAILQQFIDSCKKKGAEPVLVTSICRRIYRKNGKIWNSLGEYPEAMRQLAARNRIALIDLNAISEMKFAEIGEQGTIELFMHAESGKYPAYPKGAEDNTHFSEKGAAIVANWVVTAMQEQKLTVGNLFKTGTADISKPVNGYIRLDLDGTASGVAIVKVKCGSNLKISYPGYLPEETRQAYGIISSNTELSDRFRRYTFSFVPSSPGEVKLRIRGGYTKEGIEWIAYDDFKATGAELKNPDFEIVDRDYFAGWIQASSNLRIDSDRAGQGKNYAVAAHDHFLEQELEVEAGREVTVSFLARFENKGPAMTPLAKVNRAITKPLEYYRFSNNKVKYLPLADKGIKGSRIGCRKPNAKMPEIPPVNGPASRADAVTEIRRVPVNFLEENGIAGRYQIAFGFPLPEGRFFYCHSLRLANADGGEVEAGFRPIGFWPDGSAKFVEVTLAGDFAANEDKTYYLELGQIHAEIPPIQCREDGDTIKIDTGRLQTVIDKQKFNLLQDIKVDGKNVGSFAAEGLALIDEKMKIHDSSSTPPAEFKIISNDRRQLVLLAKGKYPGNIAEYEVRMFFYRDSPQVRFELTLGNCNLTQEFTDYTAWQLKFVPAAPVQKLLLDTQAIGSTAFQWTEKDLASDGVESAAALSGRGELETAGGKITFQLADAAERYPKGFEKTDKDLIFHLLPELPGAEFGTDLPYYLMFPFCEGKYRLKWGMRFTETVTIDFAGEHPVAAAPVPVIDRDYLASTKVFHGIPAADDTTFDAMDGQAGEALELHLALKKARREYGFLNYGDWFGERGRNWGNNEYDLAHGLFNYFLRTGDRRAWKTALAAARHQADVDIIHHYPDSYYVGANAQHSIGHTGVSYQRMERATWSYRLDQSFSGENGHTWCEGMVEAGMLAGDRRVFDAALLLGEHLVNHTSRDLVRLGSHERSVGWSLKALMALYRATGSKRYLDAGGRLAQVALKEHNPEAGGAWPHMLPSDHANGVANAKGNACFLVGILVDGLFQYYSVTGNAEVRQVMESAAAWLRKCWDDGGIGWPYTADAGGKPFWPPIPGLNLLIAPALLAGTDEAHRVQDFKTAAKTLDYITFSGFSRIGKELAYGLVYLPEFYEMIMRSQSQNPTCRYQYQAAEVPDRLLTLAGAKTAFPDGVPKQLGAEMIIAKSFGRFYLQLPAGCKEFTLRVTGISGGRYHAQVVDSRKRIVGECHGLNTSGTEGGGGNSGQLIRVNVPHGEQIYEVAFSGSGKVGFALVGDEAGIRLEKTGFSGK